MLVVVLLPLVALDRLPRDRVLGPLDRDRRRDRVPHRAGARACPDCSTRDPAASRSRASTTASTPGAIGYRERLHPGDRVHRAGPDRLGGGGPAGRGDENPRRNVPRAIMISIADHRRDARHHDLGPGHRLGHQQPHQAAGSAELPALVIAHRVWGSVWWFALLAMFTSVFGASLACQNVATRMWFGMGRSGVLPQRSRSRTRCARRRRPRSRRSSSCP